ncbi:outer membrane protein assembly factor BamB family protein [Streptomyces sp. NPDC001732]
MLGGYRLLARLGQGGMGRVYLAEDRRSALYALKVVHPERAHDPEFRRRFAREIRLAARVRGAGVASVTGADPDAETPWLATEFVPGPTLGEAISQHGELPAGACRALAEQLAEALTAVHATGLVHRDLKPSNVILGAGGARLIDFGIALADDESAITRTGQTLGTPGYIAPEVLRGGAAGPAADVFALGALLAFAAQGRHPYGTGPAAAVMVRPLAAAPDLSGVTDVTLAALLRRALAQEPAHRPPLAEFAALADPGTADGGSWIPQTLLDDIGGRTLEVTTLVRTRRVGAPRPHPPTAVNAPASGAGRMPVPRGTAPAPLGPGRHVTRRGVLGLGAAAAAGGTAAWLVSRNSSSGPAPKTLWQHAMKGSPGTLVVTRDTVYANGDEDGLVALDARTGKQRWHRSLNNAVCGPVPGNNTLYHSDGKRLTALDSRSGATRWSAPLPAGSGYPVISGPDLVYLSGEPVHALDAADGSRRWSYEHDPSVPDLVSCLLSGNALFVYGTTGVDRVDAATGQRLWQQTELQAPQCLAMSDGKLYVGHFGGVSLLDPDDGTVRKTIARSDFYVFDIAIAGPTLCIDADDRVRGVDAITGQERWSADLGKHTRLSQSGGGALAVYSDTMVCAVDTSTGAVRWRLSDTSPKSVAPVIADGVAYIGTERRGLLALSTAAPA